MEQIVDSPGGGPQDFRPGQSSSTSFSSPAGVHGFADESQRARQCQLTDSGGL